MYFNLRNAKWQMLAFFVETPADDLQMNMFSEIAGCHVSR